MQLGGQRQRALTSTGAFCRKCFAEGVPSLCAHKAQSALASFSTVDLRAPQQVGVLRGLERGREGAEEGGMRCKVQSALASSLTVDLRAPQQVGA